MKTLAIFPFMALSLTAQASPLKPIEWLIGSWDCKMKKTEIYRGKVTESASEGRFVVKADLGANWLEGRFYNKQGIELTRSFYGHNSKKQKHIMYFMDKFGGHGRGVFTKTSKNRLVYTGDSELGDYFSTFTKTFIKVSNKQYDVEYVVNNPQSKYRSKSKGICLKN